MTLEEESRLSFYKALTVIDKKKNVVLVQNIEDNQIYVKKMVDIYLQPVYKQLMQSHIDGIPDIIECVEDKNKLIIIEEYIQGRNLLQIMHENGLAGDSYAYHVMMDLTQILIKLHGMTPPVIHRDIKPSNIIIDKNGHAYLIDFDAARNVNSDRDEDTRMLGTQYFAAPEQYGFGQSDMRTDIYGLGAAINYLMTGDKPGAGVKQCRLYQILSRCLMIDPKDRYQSADELYRALVAVSSSFFVNGNFVNGNGGFNGHGANVKGTPESNLHDKADRFYHVYMGGAENRNNNYQDSWRRFLPPGFRSGNIVYCISAALWYLFMAAVSSQLDVTDNGEPVSNTYLIANRVAMFIAMLVNTLWYGNYLNIRDKFPGMGKKGIGSFVVMVSLGFGLTIMVVIVMLLVLYIIGA